MNKLHKVYAHVDEAKIFYIGKGVGGRPNDKSSRTKRWKKYVKNMKGDFNVVVLKSFNGNDAALDYEKKMIIKHRPECNVTHNGGKARDMVQKRTIKDAIDLCKKHNKGLVIEYLPSMDRWVLRSKGMVKENLWLCDESRKNINSCEINVLTNDEMCSNLGIDQACSDSLLDSTPISMKSALWAIEH